MCRSRRCRIKGAHDGGCTVNAVNTNLGANGQRGPLSARAPLSTRELDTPVTLSHGLGHVSGLANQTVSVAGNVTAGPVDTPF